MTQPSTTGHHFKTGLSAGLRKGWSGYLWIMKIVVPISFLTMLLDASGWIQRIDFILEPAMTLLGLPTTAALPLIAGLLTGIYGGIAAMSILPLTTEQMTLIAVFLLISHALPQEGVVQGKSGMHPLKATLLRLVASVVTVVILARIIGADPQEAMSATGNLPQSAPFYVLLVGWLRETALLGVKMFCIIMVLMALLGVMSQYDLIRPIVRFLNPFLKLLGLDRKVGILWLTAAIFGISYGAAVIVEEVKETDLTVSELERLQASIGINHAMIEDPAMFLPFGIHPLWLWLPRLLAAMIVVHLLNLWRRLVKPHVSTRATDHRVSATSLSGPHP